MVLATEAQPSEITNIANLKTSMSYKMTEFGLIPEDWHQVNLGDKSIKIGSGITPTGGERIYKQSGRPFLRSQNIANGHLLLDAIAYIDEETHESFKSTEVKAKDVLLNITGASIGRCAVADERVQGGNVNQHVCIIRTNKNELDSDFLNYFLLSSAGQSQIDSFQAGGNREGLNFGQIRSFTLPCPSLKEQKTIAVALKDIDSLINSLDQLIVKKRNIKLATMEQLLTGKQRLPGFSEDWKLKRIGDIFEFLSTANNPRSDLSDHGEIGYIHYGDIHGSSSSFFNCSKKSMPYIDQIKVKNLPYLEVGDLVIADASEDYEGIGKSIEILQLNNKKIVAGLHTFLLRGNKSVIADGFKGYLQYMPSFRRDIVRLATGISVYGISKNNLRDVQVKLPSIHEQVAIAKVLYDMDIEISTIEQQLAKARKLKQGMMQELLTGRIRLT